jgi:hypothetical protein
VHQFAFGGIGVEALIIASSPYARRGVLWTTYTEGHHAVVEEIGRGERGLAIVELGEGDLGAGVDEGLLVGASPLITAAARESAAMNEQIFRIVCAAAHRHDSHFSITLNSRARALEEG